MRDGNRHMRASAMDALDTTQLWEQLLCTGWFYDKVLQLHEFIATGWTRGATAYFAFATGLDGIMATRFFYQRSSPLGGRTLGRLRCRCNVRGGKDGRKKMEPASLQAP